MALRTKPLETLYLKGFSIDVPFEKEVYNLPPLEKDKWAVTFLKENGIKRKKVTRVGFSEWGGIGHMPSKMRIDSYDYKI